MGRSGTRASARTASDGPTRTTVFRDRNGAVLVAGAQVAWGADTRVGARDNKRGFLVGFEPELFNPNRTLARLILSSHGSWKTTVEEPGRLLLISSAKAEENAEKAQTIFSRLQEEATARQRESYEADPTIAFDRPSWVEPEAWTEMPMQGRLNMLELTHAEALEQLKRSSALAWLWQ